MSKEDDADGRAVIVAQRIIKIGLPVEAKRFETRQMHLDLTMMQRELYDADVVAEAQAEVQKMVLSMLIAPHHGSRQPAKLRQPMWLAVFDVRGPTRTAAELYVADDDDASAQLDILAPALGFQRDVITVKPRPGWQGYGHPELFPHR